MQTIPLSNLAIAFAPTVIVLLWLHHWRLGALTALYANGRMLVQLLLIGYVLTYIFQTDQPIVIVGVVGLMISVASWISVRTVRARGWRGYLIALVAIGSCGMLMLAIVTQFVITSPQWFEPRLVVPLAGMIFANAMNTVSVSAERFDAELERGEATIDAQKAALEAGLIPQINSLFAVGLVSLPGMMTGQILSGVDPLIAARYQIMVMCMIFGSAGLAAPVYLALTVRFKRQPAGE